MATTSPDNLRTPNPGDPYNLVPDLQTLAQDVQDALTRRANVFTGTSSQRTAFTSTATNGMLWQDTNDIKMIWRKDGSAWVPAVWRWGGTTAQMNSFTQAPAGFEWYNTTDNSEYVRSGGAWLGGWVDITIPNWTTQAGATPGVKFSGGIVSFRGIISNPTFNGGFTTIASIPAGIPLPSQVYSAGTVTMNSPTEAKARVTDSGDLQMWRNGQAAAWVSLAGLSYAP